MMWYWCGADMILYGYNVAAENDVMILGWYLIHLKVVREDI